MNFDKEVLDVQFDVALLLGRVLHFVHLELKLFDSFDSLLCIVTNLSPKVFFILQMFNNQFVVLNPILVTLSLGQDASKFSQVNLNGLPWLRWKFEAEN